MGAGRGLWDPVVSSPMSAPAAVVALLTLVADVIVRRAGPGRPATSVRMGTLEQRVSTPMLVIARGMAP